MGIEERKSREKLKRRNEILKKAEKLFSGKKGLNATMDDLATLTELAKGTLYLYYQNKESILTELARKGVELLRGRLTKDAVEDKTGLERLSDTGDIFVDFLNQQPFYAGLILKYEKTMIPEKSGNNILLIEPVLDVLYEIIEKGQNDNSIRTDIGTKELVAILWSQMLGILSTLGERRDILEKYGVNKDWIIKGHYRIIMNGLVVK